MILGENDKIIYQHSKNFQMKESHYFYIHSSLDKIDELKNQTQELFGKKLLQKHGQRVQLRLLHLLLRDQRKHALRLHLPQRPEENRGGRPQVLLQGTSLRVRQSHDESPLQTQLLHPKPLLRARGRKTPLRNFQVNKLKNEVRPMFFQTDFLVHQHYFLELSPVVQLSHHAVHEYRLSHQKPVLPPYRHRLVLQSHHCI